MKVAIVYDRANKWGGAERVLMALNEMYPDAPLFTSVYDPKSADWAKRFPQVKTSFLQKLSFVRKNHEFLALFMPLAFRFFNFKGYDLVISVTSEFAKSIKTGKSTLHVCYCLTPTRYLWSGYRQYFKNRLFRIITYPAVFFLRKVDLRISKNPDIIIAISTCVAERIKKYYGRNSHIVFPPVNTRSYKATRSKQSEYYLLVSRLDFGYKKVDLAIKAFNKLGKKLVIVGTGRQTRKLKKLAEPNIVFAGKVTDTKLATYYKNAKALIMPQEEDFGIVAVEAQSFGVPVVAYKKGGAEDTVISGKTGLLFGPQNESALVRAVLRFENMTFKADNLSTHTKKFDIKNFKNNFGKIVQNGINTRQL